TVTRECIPKSLTQNQEDKAAIIVFSTRYAFKSWLRDLPGTPPAGARPLAAAPAHAATAAVQAGLFEQDAAAPAPATRQYETVLTEAQLSAWLARIDKAALTSVDTETTALDPMAAQMVRQSLCCGPGGAAHTRLRPQHA